MIINHHTTWARSGYGILFDKFLVHYRALLRGQNFGPAKTSCKGETTTNHMSRRCQVHNGDGLDAFYAYYSKRNSACTVNTQLLCIIHCNYTNTLSCQWLTYRTYPSISNRRWISRKICFTLPWHRWRLSNSYSMRDQGTLFRFMWMWKKPPETQTQEAPTGDVLGDPTHWGYRVRCRKEAKREYCNCCQHIGSKWIHG